MKYEYDTYGERIAGHYDEWYGAIEEGTVELLAELARGGRALELGIGTGRVALPLQARGVDVHGIDVSPSMVAKMRAKPGGEHIGVTMGSMADVAVEGRFDLVYVLANTFYGLLTQDEQVACLRNVAEHLEPAGCFVVEAFVPDMKRFDGGQNLRVTQLAEGRVRFDAAMVDTVSQQVTAQHVVLSEAGVRIYPVKIRYAWPSEFELMARLAGLRLRDRWANWQKAPFGADSTKHVSVYERAE